MTSVVIPCYKVVNQIKGVIDRIGPEVSKIYVVDDACPDGSGDWVKSNIQDNRVEVIHHDKNLGVGGAVMTGYKAALKAGASVVVKVDGDGQMDPGLIPKFIAPILGGNADYVKGNRFFFLDGIAGMPTVRIIGNMALSFINKVVSGYWTLMDPTNGFTAISKEALEKIPLDKIALDYFFESDVLFRLNTVRAVVHDLPIPVSYGEEVSNLKISRVLFSFPPRYANRLFKRIVYNYFLRDFSAGSLFLLGGIAGLVVSFLYGGYYWWHSIQTGIATPTGTIMVAAIVFIFGYQSLLFFLQQDVASVPQRPLSQNRLN